MSINDLKRQADELAASEVIVATNEGTFGAEECCRKVGSGDPRYGTYRVYVRVGDGQRRHEGCDLERAPGYRRDSSRVLVERQAGLRELRRQIAEMAR